VFAVGREQRTGPEVDWVFRRVRRHGSIDFARAVLRQMVEAAQQEFRGRRGSPPRLAPR
jgi:hypothetical protein